MRALVLVAVLVGSTFLLSGCFFPAPGYYEGGVGYHGDYHGGGAGHMAFGYGGQDYVHN